MRLLSRALRYGGLDASVTSPRFVPSSKGHCLEFCYFSNYGRAYYDDPVADPGKVDLDLVSDGNGTTTIWTQGLTLQDFGWIRVRFPILTDAMGEVRLRFNATLDDGVVRNLALAVDSVRMREGVEDCEPLFE